MSTLALLVALKLLHKLTIIPYTMSLQLREECFQRLDAARSQLLETARRSRSSGTPGVQDALRSIISDSSARLTTQTRKPPLGTPNRVPTAAPSSFSLPLNGAPAAALPSCAATAANEDSSSNINKPEGITLGPTIDDTLVEDAPLASTRVLLSPSKAQQQPPAFSQLSPGEYEDLMRSLEASLYEDMLQDEADYLDSLEQRDIDDMVEAHLGRMALGGTGGGGETIGTQSGDDEYEDGIENNVLCPLCQDAWLIQRNGVILCPRRHLRLDAAMEGLQMKDLRRRLAAVLEQHSGGGGGGCGEGQQRCLGRVVFEQAGAPGVNSLVMRCDTCGALEIVM